MLRTVWNMTRLPVLAVLTVFAAPITTMLGGIAFFGLLTALFFRFATPIANFPFWPLVGVSAAGAAALVLYYALIRALSDEGIHL